MRRSIEHEAGVARSSGASNVFAAVVGGMLQTKCVDGGCDSVISAVLFICWYVGSRKQETHRHLIE